MSWGVEVQGTFGRLPIDEDYKNLVRRGQGSVSLGTGYHVVTMESRGVFSLVVSARHPGLDVALLGYTQDAYGTTGVRLYVRGSGRFYWRTYEDAYPLPMTGWGMVVFNAAGEQTFHSDHRYADVMDSRYYLGSLGRYLGGNYYLLNTPSTPTFEYDAQQFTRASPIRSYQQTGTRRRYVRERVYSCDYVRRLVNGRMQSVLECGNKDVWRWVNEPVYGWVITSYNVLVEVVIYCTKHMSLVRHSGGNYVSEYRYRVNNNQSAYYHSYRYIDPVGRIYSDGGWYFSTFPNLARLHLSVVSVPTYASVAGHSNKLVILQ